MNTAKLTLHCGARAVEMAAVAAVRTPKPTETWNPIPHVDLIGQVRRVLEMNKLTVVHEAHSLTHDGMRYFGLMQIKNGEVREDYAWILGLRNSHDKVFPAGMVAGAKVFICDNLSFSGEVRFDRKHTRFITRDLPQLTERAVGRLMTKWHHQDRRLDAYKEMHIGDMEVHDLVIKSVDVRACTPRQIPEILNQWRVPEFEQFEARTVWSLFNGFTRVMNKTENLNELTKRTEALHGLLDTYVGLGREEHKIKAEDTPA